MTALILLTLLVGGGLAYIRWAAHWVANGAAIGWFIAGAPIAYFAPALVLVTVWFTLAWIWRTPRPPGARLGPGASVRLFVGEVAAVAASWPLMALHRLLIRDPAPTAAALPIVLIHGVLVNDGVWLTFKRYFASHGSPGCICARQRPGKVHAIMLPWCGVPMVTSRATRSLPNWRRYARATKPPML